MRRENVVSIDIEFPSIFRGVASISNVQRRGGSSKEELEETYGNERETGGEHRLEDEGVTGSKSVVAVEGRILREFTSSEPRFAWRAVWGFRRQVWQPHSPVNELHQLLIKSTLRYIQEPLFFPFWATEICCHDTTSHIFWDRPPDNNGALADHLRHIRECHKDILTSKQLPIDPLLPLPTRLDQTVAMNRALSHPTPLAHSRPS
jgi:hypothetical protein